MDSTEGPAAEGGESLTASQAAKGAGRSFYVAGRDLIGWALLAGLLLVQYGLFREFVLRELAPTYPRMFDQAGYLFATYGLHEAILDNGLSSAGRLAWEQRSPQSLLFQPEAALLMLFTGASRLGALSFVFLHFALLQLVLVATLRRLSGGWMAPGLALGLLLSARTAFGWGGLSDFRTDLPALCLEGLFLCVVLASNSFARPWAGLYVGAAALYLALFRYVSSVYLCGTLLAFGAWLLFAWRRAAPEERPACAARLRGLGLALGVLVLGVLAAGWASRELLRNYYWRGQHEAADQHSAGVSAGLPGLLYYARSLGVQHTGPTFGVLALSALAAAAVALRGPRRAPQGGPAVPFDALPAAAFLGLATGVPIAVLALNEAKSPIVAGFVVPALVLLAALPAVAAARRGTGVLQRRLLSSLSAVFVVVGLTLQTAFFARHLPAAERADALEATRLLESVAQICHEMGWRQPVMLYDATNEFQMPWAAAVLSYERLGWYFGPMVPIGAPGYLPAKPQAVRRVFAAADVAMLVRRAPPRFEPNFAFDRSVRSLRAELLARADRELTLIERRTVGDWVVDAYVRPGATIVEPLIPPRTAWTWITDAGLTLATSARLLRARPEIQLEGRARLEWIGGRLPAVSGTLVPAQGAPLPLRITSWTQDTDYFIQVHCDVARLPASGRVLIHLDFDRSFRPADVGLGKDPRRLVIPTPQVIRLQPATAALQDVAPQAAAR